MPIPILQTQFQAFRREPWRRTLLLLWMAQILASTGFQFAVPFVPYYFQEMGVQDKAELKLWVSLFGAALPLTMALIAPVWGAISDRFGRRLMALRATGAGVVILALMGLAQSPAQLIVLRLIQGLFTGTMMAVQTMASVSTPSSRGGLALGVISSAAFSGAMLGGFLGGIMADLFGYRPSFFLASGLLLLSLFCLLFGTSPDTPNAPAADSARKGPPVNGVLAGLPILLLLAFMAMVRMFDSSFLPLLVQEIHGKLEGASVRSGTLAAVGAVAGMIAGLVMGRLADRMGPPAVGRLSAIGAALLMIPQGLAHSFLMLLGARAGMVFFSGGLDPVFLIWLSKTTPKSQRGVVFGWAQTAKSAGWFLAPLASGAVAAGFGVRTIYFVGAALFLLLVPGIQWTVRRLQRAGAGLTPERPAAPGAPGPDAVAGGAGPSGSGA
jgi:DHA1 family multidrug resistance protein-like MFS transporter